MIIILMGVAGSGKTTIGSLLAAELGWLFYDADDFHPPANIIKMRSGIPLTDTDRQPWLHALENLLKELIANNHSAVLACSALKAAYRAQLKASAGSTTSQIKFVYLRIPPPVAMQRLEKRKTHFMPKELVPSQFEALEEPSDAVVVNAMLKPSEVVAQIRQALGL
jgi:gluconokinase